MRCLLILTLGVLYSLNAIANSIFHKYELHVQEITHNLTGVDVSHALAINGQIPAPTLRFKKGEMAHITVINETSEPTTMHWHGILVPWNMDGPYFSNNKLIQPGEQFVFTF
jgi:FtsP/CotA-like multicopper oxidase with cupredoxin domain